jgi:hypothetical protein
MPTLGQIWADEMNKKVPAGTFQQACFDMAKPPKHKKTPMRCSTCQRECSYRTSTNAEHVWCENWQG